MRSPAFLLIAASAISAFAWEGPKLTVAPNAPKATRTWSDVKSAVAKSIAKTGDGYLCYSQRFNDLGPIDTSGTLTPEELKTQFALACVLASPITVSGPAPAAVTAWLADKMLMNVNGDYVARQGHVVVERDGVLVIKKYMWDMNAGNNVFAFYNPTDEMKTITVDARELELTGPVKWTDRFEPTRTGSFAASFTVSLSPHATRLYYMNAKPVMRCRYGAECARTVEAGRVFDCVYAPKTGDYRLLLETDGTEPVTVNVNGLIVGACAGVTDLAVTLWKTENRVLLMGPGATEIKAIRVYDAKSPLQNITLALRLARAGKDHQSNDAIQRARALKAEVIDPEQTSDAEMRYALEWIHDVYWEWEFEWLWSRVCKADGNYARALELLGEKGCRRFAKYGVVPKGAAFEAYEAELKKLAPPPEAKKGEKDFEKEFANPPAAEGMNAVEWQNTNDVKLAVALTDAKLAECVKDEAAARALLDGVTSLYGTDALVLTKIAAVSQYVMCADGASRDVWCEALVKTIERTPDAGRIVFFLDQLRWCGRPTDVKFLYHLVGSSTDAHVREMADLVAHELTR